MDIRSKIFQEDNFNNYTAMYGWQVNLGQDMVDFGYILSYKEAADILVDKCLPDLLLFPVIFCYRQYLELLLKNIYRRNSIDQQYQEFIKKTSHNLKLILSDVKLYLDEECIEYIEQIVEIFDELDPRSYNFRYPTDKNLNNSINNELYINLLNLKKAIDCVDDILRCKYDSID